MTKDHIRLMATAYFQILFVAINTTFIAKGLPLGVAFATYSIQYLWTINVKKVVFAKEFDRHLYSISGTAGALTGYYLGNLLLSVI